MKFLITILIVFLSVFSNGQNTCNSAQIISAEQLANVSLNGKSKYFKILNDSSFSSFNITGDFNKLVVYKKSNCAKLEVLAEYNNIGIYQPTPIQIDQGYCFCEKCIDRLSKIKLSSSEPILIKIEGGSSIDVKLNKPQSNQPPVWYEKKYMKGDRINLTNIMFIAGTPKFQRSSYKDLELLWILLKKQPSLNIEIQGHVNGPRLKNKKSFQLLSEHRAKAVLDFLVSKGIEASRLTSQGYGNTKMIFPEAESEYRMQFNRRVEILVL